jgi:hemerythrin
MTPTENFEFINSYLSQMEPVISKHGGIIDKFIGDAILALFEFGADSALRGAISMHEKLESYNAGRARAGYIPVHIGIALNTGMVMIGTVGGNNRMDTTVIGDAVNLAARLEDYTKTYHAPLLISHNTFYDLENPKKFCIRFLDRIRVKGRYQPISIYEVYDNDPIHLREGKLASQPLFEQALAYYHLKDIPRAAGLLKQCLKRTPDDAPALIYLERCNEYLETGNHISTGEFDTTQPWKDEFVTGLEELDTAHQELWKKVNGLTAQIKHGDITGYRHIFPFLNKYTRQIFELEETLMREQGYPFSDSHAQEHARFIENFKALEERTKTSQEDPRYLSFRTELLLLDWFSSHSTKADRHMARFLQHSSKR